jgi:hypothetical protein
MGYRCNWRGPIRLVSVSVSAAVTPGTGDLPGERRGQLEAMGRYLDGHAARAQNRSDFYDLFGPTKRSGKGFANVSRPNKASRIALWISPWRRSSGIAAPFMACCW